MPVDTPAGLVLVDRPRTEVAVVTLNRPEKLNALSFALVDELHAALDDLQADNKCRVVVLTGAGRGFCSGLDLSSIEGSSTSAGTTGPRAGMLSQTHIAALPQKLRRLQQPVIAAVNGAAYGGGFALALACDIRVAAPEARFCTQFVKLGLGGCDIGISRPPREPHPDPRLDRRRGDGSRRRVHGEATAQLGQRGATMTNPFGYARGNLDSIN